ncbi:hypothetical protein Vadar_027333 [Vaccinium darrowii]|uniref:Uncharacterized protein n=1 Tax=Vaccinium darrowii TaxID=229202 RepID=A0ACB7YYX3_9ERIC|nr:hypothetical protein Vadar_027333 [Vaccinium darrowii]
MASKVDSSGVFTVGVMYRAWAKRFGPWKESVDLIGTWTECCTTKGSMLFLGNIPSNNGQAAGQVKNSEPRAPLVWRPGPPFQGVAAMKLYQGTVAILVSSLSRGSYYTENHERAGPYLQRYDAHSGGEREIQRTMLELLNELDGFDSGGDVKVILATNKIESLDPALIQPDRIDRKIEFPTHTSRMTLADDVNLEEFFMTKEEFSGADVKAKCTEAGLFALRERHMKVMHADIKKAKDKIMFKKKEEVPKGLYM